MGYKEGGRFGIGGKNYHLKMNPFYTVLGQMWLKIVINNNQAM
jgi:hypothetical protein|tara:strand:+ start:783 stop:911 length:129 start_codon:yes stop_codon:yes gene_type:complete